MDQTLNAAKNDKHAIKRWKPMYHYANIIPSCRNLKLI